MPPPTERRPPIPFWIYPAAILAYGASFQLSYWSANNGDKVAPLWLAAGLGIWLVLHFGYRMLWVVALGELLSLLRHTPPLSDPLILAMRLLMSSGNVLTIFLGSWLWRWADTHARGRWGKFREATAGLATAALAPMAAASLGVAALLVSGRIARVDWPPRWFAWWTGDMIGILFMLPLLLALPALGRRLRNAGPGDLPRSLFLLGACAALGWLAFWRPEGARYLFVLFPLLVLATSWFEAPGVRVVGCLMVAAGTFAAAHGRGPLVTGNLREDLANVQLFLTAIALFALLLPPLHARVNLLRRLPLLLLLGGGTLSGLLFTLVQNQQDQTDKTDFIRLTEGARRAIQRQLEACTAVMRSGAGFLLAAPGSGQMGWGDFTRAINLPQNYPGLLSLGVVYPVPAAAAEAFPAGWQATGTPPFTIHPIPGFTSPPGAERYVLAQLEPLAGNEAALGFDLASDPVRRLAAEAARDSGLPRITGRIGLPQDRVIRPGFLLFMPVYRLGAPVTTVAERRAALLAWIDAPLRTDTFLLGALGDRAPKLQVHLFDGSVPDRAHVIFDSGPATPGLPVFEQVSSFELAGRQFMLGWNRGPGFGLTHHSPLIWMAVSLAVATVLLTGWVMSLQAFRERAEAQVTERTAALAESEARYRTLIEGSPEATFVHSGGKFVYGNPVALSLIGAATVQELVGQPVLDRVHPDFQQIVRERAVRLTDPASREPMLACRVFKLDGTPVDVEIKATAIVYNAVPAVHVVVRDVTARKLAEAAQAEALDRLEKIASQVPGVVYQFRLRPDGTSCLPYASAALRHVFGVNAEEVREDSAKIFAALHVDDLAGVTTSIQASARDLTLWSHEFRVQQPDGQMHWILANAQPQREADGATLWHGFLTNITARKLAEEKQEKLETQNQQLQKSESLGRMAAAIAHHFNNQLHAVLMNLELARADLAPDSDPFEHLAEAMKCTRKATDVSTQMLTYLGQSKGRHEILDLAAACKASLALLQAVMPKQVLLESSLPAPGPLVSANANQIQQLLTNLVTNAWEACGDRTGVIRLTIRTVPAAAVPANRFPVDWQPEAAAYACLEVADSGSGIPAGDTGKLFEPFFSNKFVGRGLGLPVALGIVRAHRGTIAVETEVNRGTVFRIYLPLAPALPVTPSLPAAAHALPPAGGPTVLVAEDDPVVLKVTLQALRHFGYPVLAARDGLEAVELFRAHRAEIGCVLCDLSMPRLGGWETLTALRRLAPGLPVILSSGHDESQVMMGEHDELPQAFLNKPYDPKTLVAAITRALGSPGQH